MVNITSQVLSESRVEDTNLNHEKLMYLLSGDNKDAPWRPLTDLPSMAGSYHMATNMLKVVSSAT